GALSWSLWPSVGCRDAPCVRPGRPLVLHVIQPVWAQVLPVPDVYARPMTSLRRLVEGAAARVAHIGADPRDDVDTRQRKALLVLISVLILPISLLWGCLYLAF